MAGDERLLGPVGQLEMDLKWRNMYLLYLIFGMVLQKDGGVGLHLTLPWRGSHCIPCFIDVVLKWLALLRLGLISTVSSYISNPFTMFKCFDASMRM